MLKLAGESVDAVCDDADGSCSTSPYEAVDEVPPADQNANGFLETVDLPVFAGIEPAWAATPIATVTRNMSSTPCEDANFSREGATRVTARSYVVPESKQLPPVFGMNETIGAFPSVNAARTFMSTVYRNARKCEDRQLNLKVKRESTVHVGGANGRVWQIVSAASETRSFLYRVCLLRVGNTVAEATFTPSAPYDVAQAQYVRIAQRVGQRLAQAQPAG
jgi:hypothetical protein